MTQMEPRFSTDLWPSIIPFESERIHAVAVYCSDGRFGEQCDDFLQRGLALPNYDRLAVPGGAAGLAADREGSGLFSGLMFLVKAHELTRLVMIAHQDCAHYTQLLDLGAIDARARQEADVASVAQRVREQAPQVQVDAFLAHVEGERVSFEQLRL